MIQFDLSGFQKWIDNNPELKGQIEELKYIWSFEFDTVDNRKIMNDQIKELIRSHIPKRRNDKIDSILE